jgi:hypothetical protein
MDKNEVSAVETNDNLDFEILEVTEATALEEMGASSTIGSGSTCSKPN